MSRCAWCADGNPTPRHRFCSALCQGKHRYDRERDKWAAWYANNREKKLAYQKSLYADTAETRRQYRRQYCLENREKLRAAKLLARGETHGCITEAAIAALLDNDTCIYCGAPSEHIDHVVAMGTGGANCIANLVMACAKCNQSKHAKPLEEWRPDLVEVVRGKLAHCPIEVHSAAG